jgi:hypothetical protein
MQSFKDNQGATWSIEITVTTVKRLKNELDLDLMKIAEPDSDLLDRLAGDPILLVDALWVICRDNATITDEEFGQRMGGESIDNAVMALMEAIADFFPRARREILRKMIAKARQAEETVLSRVSEKMDSGEIESEVERQLNEHGL